MEKLSFLFMNISETSRNMQKWEEYHNQIINFLCNLCINRIIPINLLYEIPAKEHARGFCKCKYGNMRKKLNSNSSEKAQHQLYTNF